MRRIPRCVLFLLGCGLLVPWAHRAVAGPESEPLKLLKEAKRLYDAKSHAQALKLLERLRQRAPNDADAHRLRGHCLAALGRTGEARAAFVEALSRGGLSVDLLVRLAQIDAQAERPASALAELRLLVILDLDPAHRLNYAELFLAHGARVEARALLDEVLTRDPARAAAHRLLGQLEQEAGRDDVALREFELAHHLGERSPELVSLIAELWRRRGDPARAAAWLARAAAPDAASRLRRAELLLAAGRPQEAEASLEGAPDLDPGQVALMRGRLAAARGDALGTRAAFRAAYEAGRRDPSLLRWLGEDAYRAKDYAVAVPWLQAAYDGASAKPRTKLRRLLAWSLTHSAQPERARELIREHIAEQGLDAEARALIRACGQR